MLFSERCISSVKASSPASRGGIHKGDILLSCNGSPVRDWVDFLLFSSSESVSLKIRRGPLQRVVKLKRRPGAEWGIELEGSHARVCRNRCIFCFVDQQPPGLRNTLLVKDDDVRYSFLSGTYITLTSEQTDEAISRRFSSLHVSVQASDPVLRGRMLGFPGSLPVLPQIDRLHENGIEVQAQIVEVPGWNDGKALENTISDLYHRENVKTLGVVPVGLTKWRTGLEPLVRPDKAQALETLGIIEKWQTRAQAERMTPWIYAADEYYQIAQVSIPPAKNYDSCTLQANGIGLLARMINECSSRKFTGSGIVVTGTVAAPYIGSILEGTDYRVIPVLNTLMGHMVGVAGLLSGEDVINALIETEGDQEVFLPSVMFNHHGKTMDEYSAPGIEEKTGMKITTANSIGDLK
jgi:putative radical SAM enzyme (TIGR03279 family)